MRSSPAARHEALWEKARRERERRRCAADPAYFIDTYCMLEADTGAGVVPFRLFDYQRETLATWIAHLETITLKARQLGVSELAAAYALWQVNFHASNRVINFSINDDKATEFARKCRIAYDHLPAWLRVPLANPRLISSLELANGSRILPQVATENSARSLNCQLLILDEWAHLAYGRGIFQAASITARSAGNRIIGISTANGAGDIFHEQWLKWEEGEPGAMHGVFLPWHIRPGRDQAWYDRNTQGFEEWFKHQEFPGDPTTAFALSGRSRFAMDALAWMIDTSCAPPLRVEDLDGACGTLRVWEEPRPGRRYICGADTAEGLPHGDYDAAVILDWQTGVEVAEVHGHWEAGVYAHHLAAACRRYNNALIAVEQNNHGGTVLHVLKTDERYPALYAYEGMDAPAPPANARAVTQDDGKLGWPTNRATKPVIIDGLAMTIKERRPFRNVAFVGEARTYVVKDGGKTGASGQLHDDRVMAYAIAEQVRSLPLPARQAVPTASAPRPIVDAARDQYRRFGVK